MRTEWGGTAARRQHASPACRCLGPLAERLIQFGGEHRAFARGSALLCADHSLTLLASTLSRRDQAPVTMSAALEAARAEGPKTHRLFGFPLHGSYAPFLHNTITRLAGVPRKYSKMEGKSDRLDEFLAYLRSDECAGSAVTMCGIFPSGLAGRRSLVRGPAGPSRRLFQTC